MTKTTSKARPKAKANPKTAKARTPRKAVMLRLERGEGDARVFWEITRSQLTVTTHFGRYLNAGRTVTKEYEDKRSAEATVARAILEKRGEGYSEPAPKGIIGGSSRKGVSARNPELEALIEEDPSDLQRYLIYADWLQQQGDPRGELIVVQHGLATAVSDRDLDSLEHIEEELFKRFSGDLLGELARYTRIRLPLGRASQRGLAWRCGFIRAARLPAHSEHALRLLLVHPSGRFLEHLGVSGSSIEDASEALHKTMPRTLTTLAVSDVWEKVSLAPLGLIPTLRRLRLAGGVHRVGLDAVHGLEELDVGLASPVTLDALSTATWPSLKRLHLTLSVIDGVDVGERLCAILRRMPALEHVTLRRWLIDNNGVVIRQDSLAQTLLRVFETEKTSVTRLDLEMPLSTDGAGALIPLVRALPPTLRLHFPALAVPEPALRAICTRELGIVLVDEEPDESERDNIDAHHHSASSRVC